MMQLSGTGVAMVTPFHDDHTVDFDGLTRLTHHLIDGGVEFLVILGTTGEAATLSPEEKDQVIQTIIDANAGRIPYVIGAGGNHTAAVVKTIRELDARYNAAAYLSVSPYYNKPSQQGIAAHYAAVAGATEKSIILYNVPGRTSSNVLPGTVVDIAKKNSNINAVKEASGNPEQGMSIIHAGLKDFSVLSGDDMLTLGMMATGFDGVISVIANSHPREFSDMVRHAAKGEMEPARELHYGLFDLMQLIFREGNPVGIKSVLKHLGICGDAVRLPLVPASAALSGDIARALGK